MQKAGSVRVIPEHCPALHFLRIALSLKSGNFHLTEMRKNRSMVLIKKGSIPNSGSP